MRSKDKRIEVPLVKGSITNNESMIQWVTIQKYSHLTGYSVGALYQKMRRGDLIDGTHYRRAPDGRIHLNVPACQRWVAP